MQELIVTALWDDEAQVWLATSDDIPGLVVEASTCDALVKELQLLIPDLLEENGMIPKDADQTISFKLLSEALIHAEHKKQNCLNG
ncbi:MAG: hypothetical protein BMS9Abin26_1121 [Gammaproteobacteria bacterium]|nr:MAG: hypothetical protein BMS9Abin26_1121 [Gammaproteobacteria bacterium]